MTTGTAAGLGIGIGEEHEALAAAVARFAADRCPSSVVRAAVDHGDRDAPALRAELADLGWLGLHLPESCGGGGYGLSEAAIVLEGLAAAVAPGPLLPTFWAGAVIGASVGDEPGADLREHVRGLATGEISGALALGAALEGRRVPGGDLRMSGILDTVLGGDLAAVVVAPVALDGVERWYVVTGRAWTVTTLEPLDPTRSIARLVFDDAVVAAGDRLDGVERVTVEAIAVTLAAAECAGLASWCVATAAAHARDRRQFGRPIGQFQGVKHRCADMLVATEAARALAWDAARAIDGAGSGALGEEARLAAASAGALALDAAPEVAKDCIQVLGGIGFTWEHDAHLHLRRAVALRQLLGGSRRWRALAAELAVDGARRRLGVTLPPGAEDGRADVRAAVGRVAALERGAQRAALVEERLLVPHWPAPWGREAGAVEQLLIDEELRRAKVRQPHLAVGAWAAPTIVAYGTPAQQERWVRPTLAGEVAWCQLFSEPEAGSDLAGLRTTATRTDGGWLLNGQKVWTTMATEADWGICLVRTNLEAPRHLGITYVIVDMRSDGIDIRPLREMTGLAMFNEVFFDDTFVPDDCVIGEVDGGWPLVRTTLGNERVAMGRGSSFGGGMEALLALVTARRSADDESIDAATLDRVGALIAESHAVAVLGARATLRSVTATGAGVGPASSIRKLLGAEHDQRTQEAGLELLGPAGATAEGEAAQWTFGFLANRCLTIAGGTSEIQRNVIGERLLGLPRDPEPG